MKGVIRCNYDELEKLAGSFDTQAEQTQRLVQQVKSCVEALQCGGWDGMGAYAFYNEMDCDIFPALGKLVNALQESGELTRKISASFRQKEEEAGHVFSGMGYGLDAGAGAGGITTPGGISLDDLAFGGKGMLGLWKIIEEMGLGSLLGKNLENILGPGLGILFEGVTNPDGDWFESFGSAAMTELVGMAFPPVAIAVAGSDVLQLLGRVSSVADAWANGLIGATPMITSSLDAISGRFYGNIERLDLGALIEPLGDAAYHMTITPYVEASGDTWNNPNLANFLRLGQTITSPPGMGFMFSPDAQQGVLDGLGDFAHQAGQFVYGVADMPASIIDRGLAQATAGYMRYADILPIPDAWNHAIDNGAGWFIDRIEHGMIPGVNIPVIPIF